MTTQKIETAMTTVDMVLVDLARPWSYVPGKHYLAVTLQETVDHVGRTLRDEIDHEVANRRDLVEADQDRSDALARLFFHLHGHIGKSLQFQVNTRLKREVLDKHPVIVATANKFGVMTACLWPQGCYAVRLTFGFNFEESHSISSLAVDAKPTTSVGPWEFTPDYFV